MVKLLNTPFGNYGYVLNRDQDFSHLPVSVATNGPRRDFPPIRPSVYDARYLRTTDLSNGSKIMTVSDPHSYVKHGLLHNGQHTIVPLENQMLPLRNLTHKESRNSSGQQSKSNTNGFDLPNFNKHLKKDVASTWQERSKGLPHHAGRTTILRHHSGFAYNYAANRSGLGPLASNLGSGGEYSANKQDENTSSGDHKSNEDEKDKPPSSKKTLISINTSDKPLSKLNKQKTRRLHEIYSDMYEKMDKHRRSIILEKVRAAEKIKDSLHQVEIEERKNLLKTSSESQQKQLRKIRKKHQKDFQSRVHSLYRPKSPPKMDVENTSCQQNTQKAVLDPTELHVSLPRNVYGLPENNLEKRPETVPSKLPYRFKPGKLVLESYDQTRNVLPTKFNNVWTKASPISTPRKLKTAEGT